MNTTKRDSNIELLRIVCMIMILAIRVNYFSTGALTTVEAKEFPIQSILRSFSHALCVGAVNTFVLISGYFGIKYKTKGLISLLFQCLFFCIGIYAILLSLDLIEISKIDIASSFLLFKQAGKYWFVWSYIILYILSPVLNHFTKNCTKAEFKKVLFLFFVFQFIIDSTPSNNFYQLGFSPLSFIGLYLLVQYIRKYDITFSKTKSLSIFIGCVLLNTIAEYSIKFFNINNGIINSIIASYTNPITIVQSLALLIYFTHVKIQNKFINWVATSCFAVYLFHMHFCIVDYYTQSANRIFTEYHGIIYILIISVQISIFFIIPIIIDKIRIYSFGKLWNILEKRCPQLTK